MLVICFPSDAVVGGYGDRVVGIMALKAMSSLLGRPFRIWWTKEDVSPYIDYEAYDFERVAESAAPERHRMHFLIDNQQGLKDYLMHETRIFPDDEVNLFCLNQEIAQYLYQNPLFRDRDYVEGMLEAYAQLYTDILKPRPLVLSRVQAIVGDAGRAIVGVQVRCGDMYIPNSREAHATGIADQLHAILPRIRRHCDARHGPDYAVFVTSDHDATFHECLRVWGSDGRVLYNHDPIQHMDRPSIHDDVSKIFVDSYILSRCTVALYVSRCSNYGRISALSAPHDAIYDLDCQPLAKRDLLSKHERMPS